MLALELPVTTLKLSCEKRSYPTNEGTLATFKKPRPKAGCKIEGQGAAALCGALATNTTITELDLRCMHHSLVPADHTAWKNHKCKARNRQRARAGRSTLSEQHPPVEHSADFVVSEWQQDWRRRGSSAEQCTGGKLKCFNGRLWL